MENEGNQIPYSNITRGLTNYNALCFANAFFQIYLKLKPFQQYISNNGHPSLRKIAETYFDGESTTIQRTVRLYRELPFWHDVFQSKDINHFFYALTNAIPECNPIISITETIQHESHVTNEFHPIIHIDQFQTIQQGVSVYFASKDISHFPSILNIGINRNIIDDTGTSILARSKVSINKIIHIGSENIYRIKGIFLHTGQDTKGHFQAVVFQENNIYFCNDSNILKDIPPKGITNEFLQKHAAVCVYEKNILNETDDIDEILTLPERSTPVNEEAITRARVVARSDENPSKIIISEELDIIDNDILQYQYATIQPDKNIKTDLSEIYKDIHGYLDINFEGSSDQDFLPQRAQLQKQADTLEMITKILGRLPFNYKVTQGEINLSLVSQKLHVAALIPTEAQVNECADIVRQIFNKYKERKQLDAKQIEKELKKKLRPFLETIEPNGAMTVTRTIHPNGDATGEDEDTNSLCDEGTVDYESSDLQSDSDDDFSLSSSESNDDMQLTNTTEPEFTAEEISDVNSTDENELFSGLLSGKYKWKERVEDLGRDIIREIISKTRKKPSSQSDDQVRRMAAREDFITEYQRKGHKYKSLDEFIDHFINSRRNSSASGILYSHRQYKMIFSEWSDKGFLSPVKKRGGNPGKITEETLECLITTVLDYPEATDRERATYLNMYGPQIEDNISESTVNRILDNLNISVQTPSFSPKERNNLGYRIARHLWAEELDHLRKDPNNLIAFVDEASVVIGTRNKCRGFVSVRPCVTKGLRTKSLTILACVVPAYGTIYKWYEGSVTNHEYSRFLREASHIIRTKLCNEGTNIIIIQDNAAIHKTRKVRDTAKKCCINLFFTVPYSPQCNLLAENFFAQLKENALNKFHSLDLEPVVATPIQHKLPMLKFSIISQWDDEVKRSYDHKSSSNIYGAWLTVLDMCKSGMPLHGMHIPKQPGFVPASVHGLIHCRRLKQN